MKYKVKVEDRVFEVEISDLHSEPVVALVDGEPIEVWLDAGTAGPVSSSPTNSSAPRPSATAVPAGTSSRSSDVLAPIPGTIVSILVKVGDEVQPGTGLCVLEAMKMKNTIRSSRSGRIGAIPVVIGQSVKHHDILMEFTD